MSQNVQPARPRARGGRLALAALAAMLLAGSVAAPAIADERGHHDRDRRPERHYHHGPSGPVYGYGGPAYVQAPPPVVYAPPVYATPFSLGLNFNIR